MTEQFYRDIAALKQSGTVCLDEQTSDLETWIFGHLAPRPGENILQIGCDAPGQILSLTRKLGPTGYVLAIDRSYRSLTSLSLSSRQAGLDSTLRFLYLDLDDLSGRVHSEDFQRVLGGSALAQVKRPQEVFQAIRQALKPGGLFFFYGPARKDLMELRLFCAPFGQETRESRISLFMEQIGVPCVRAVFPHAEMTSFESQLRFATPDALYACWRESSFYVEALERDFRQAAAQHFQAYPAFETAQRLIGIKAING